MTKDILRTVMRIYGCLIAAAMIPLIDSGLVRDKYEALIAAQHIVDNTK